MFITASCYVFCSAVVHSCIYTSRYISAECTLDPLINELIGGVGVR